MKKPDLRRGRIFLTVLGTLASLSFSALPTGVVLQTFYDTVKVNLKASLVKPVSIAEVPGLPKHLYVVDLKGKLWGIFPDTTGYSGLSWYNYTGKSYKKLLLADFSNVTHYSAEGEAGAYSVCFHPLFAQNHKFYIYYYKKDSAWAASLPKYYTGSQGGVVTPFNGEDPFGNPAGSIVLDEYQANATADTVTRLREVFRWHQQPAVGGGNAKFGPDGYLYMTSGSYDGNGRNYHIYLNKVMRIDVTSTPPAGKQYVIPPDNPFASTIDPNNPFANMIFPNTTDPDTSFKREIWAAGFRNPWTTAFDPDSGTMYLGDVDEDHHEEINIVTKGGNYGWFRGGDLNNLGDGNYGNTGPGWSFSGPCASAASPYHKPGGDSCKYFTDPAYSAPRTGSHALQCVIVGTVFHGAKTSPFYGYLLGTDNTLDTLWAFKKGDSTPQSIGHPAMFGGMNHRGVGSMASGIGGTVYAAALDWYDPANRTYTGASVYYELYQVTSPDMTLQSYSDVTAGIAMENNQNQRNARLMDPSHPRLIVNLGFPAANVNAGKMYDLGGKLMSARRGVGVYYLMPNNLSH